MLVDALASSCPWSGMPLWSGVPKCSYGLGQSLLRVLVIKPCASQPRELETAIEMENVDALEAAVAIVPGFD